MQQDQKDSKQIAAVRQGGLGLPDRDYYLEKRAPDEDSRAVCRAHDEDVQACGRHAGQAAAEADNVMAIETALAEGSLNRTDLREPTKRYHIMTVAELQHDGAGIRLDHVLRRDRHCIVRVS